jgi:hypoxanthine phosphoribosyltransferase
MAVAHHLEPFISAKRLAARITSLAAEVDEAVLGKDTVGLVVLKGSLHFASDLLRAMKQPIAVDFIQAKSYEREASTGFVQILHRPAVDLAGKTVLILEDIVDTGLTLYHLHELLKEESPAEIRTVALLSKPGARQRDVPIDHVGFEIPNEFVVGYGLDYEERYRNLPFIARLSGL